MEYLASPHAFNGAGKMSVHLSADEVEDFIELYRTQENNLVLHRRDLLGVEVQKYQAVIHVKFFSKDVDTGNEITHDFTLRVNI